MRIILSLTPKEKYEINFNYHFKAMGFVYQLLMNTKFEKLHDKKMYKNFCFSNIFQSSHKQDKNWKFIISSPDEKFINQVEFSLKKVIENQIPVQLGKFFDLDSFDSSVAPAVSNIEPSFTGFTIDEAKALIQSVKNKNVIGGDVVCLMPTKDQKNNITSMVAASIMFEIISVIAYE